MRAARTTCWLKSRRRCRCHNVCPFAWRRLFEENEERKFGYAVWAHKIIYVHAGWLRFARSLRSFIYIYAYFACMHVATQCHTYKLVARKPMHDTHITDCRLRSFIYDHIVTHRRGLVSTLATRDESMTLATTSERYYTKRWRIPKLPYDVTCVVCMSRVIFMHISAHMWCMHSHWVFARCAWIRSSHKFFPIFFFSFRWWYVIRII